MLKRTKALLLGLFVLVCGAQAVYAQGNFRVRVQMIHASPDPDLRVIDVYLWAVNPLNGQPAGLDTIRNFTYLTTDGFLNRVVPIPFGPVPASFNAKITLCPANSTGLIDSVKTFDLTVFENDTAHAVAYGELDQSLANPADGIGLAYFRNAKETASAGTVNSRIFHAGVDAPAVDIFANGTLQIADSLAYGNATAYLGEIPAASYTIQVRGAGSPNDVSRYTADLSGLGGQAIFIFASGYLDPTQNGNGALFGVYAVLPNGTVVKLPTTTAFGAQAVHSSADPAAALVDLYINGVKIDDVPYLGATPFSSIELPLVANNKVYVGVAPSTSTDVNDTIANFVFNVNDGDSLYLVANGVLTPADFDQTVNGGDIAFNIYPIAGATTVSGSQGVRIRPFHGITDAPAVEISAAAGALSITSGPIAYGESQAYTAPAAAAPGIDVRVFAGTTTIGNYTADLTGLNGKNILVIASGFYNSSTNKNADFGGLYAVLPNGTVAQLPSTSKASIQVVHNSADQNLGLVDAYLLDSKLDDLAFGDATAFTTFTLPFSTVSIPVGFADPNSTNVGQSIARLPLSLTDGDTAYAVVAGVSQPNNYDNTVNGIANIGLRFVKIDANPVAPSGQVTIKVFHGCTDAPAVDVYADANRVVNGAAYLASTPYLGPLPVANYTITVTPANNFAAAVDSFVADLPALNPGGNSILILATGFLDKSKNPQGSPAGKTFALNAVLPSGANVFLPKKTPASSVNEELVKQFSIFPNPAADALNVSLRGLQAGSLDVQIMDITGRTVLNHTAQVGAEANLSLDITSLPAGLYVVRAQQGAEVRTAQLVVVR